MLAHLSNHLRHRSMGRASRKAAVQLQLRFDGVEGIDETPEQSSQTRPLRRDPSTPALPPTLEQECRRGRSPPWQRLPQDGRPGV